MRHFKLETVSKINEILYYHSYVKHIDGTIYDIHSQMYFTMITIMYFLSKRSMLINLFSLQFLNPFLRSNFFSSLFLHQAVKNLVMCLQVSLVFLGLVYLSGFRVSFWTILHQDKLGEVPQVLALTRQVQLIIFPKLI